MKVRLFGIPVDLKEKVLGTFKSNNITATPAGTVDFWNMYYVVYSENDNKLIEEITNQIDDYMFKFCAGFAVLTTACNQVATEIRKENEKPIRKRWGINYNLLK
jgi:hypothetical protein